MPRDVQLANNFWLSEFKCKNGEWVPSSYMDNVTLLAKNLQVLRDYVESKHGERTITINSAYRPTAYNKKVGGGSKSQHLTAKAADIVVQGLNPRTVYNYILKLIKEGKMTAGGVGVYDKKKMFVHYDIRGVNRRWAEK